MVGGGLAGLTAAVHLKRAGCRVDLFERSRLLGGKATSFSVDGVEVDNGQHVYLACCTELIDFLDSLGFAHDGTHQTPALALQPRFEVLMLRRGRRPVRLAAGRFPPPLHLLPALLVHHGLGLRGRLQLAFAMLGALTEPLPGETFAHWLKRHGQQPSTWANFWEPFLVPALNAPLDQVSADAALFVIRTAFLQDAHSARFGFSRVPLAHLAQRAAAELDEVRMRTPVVRVRLPERRAESGIELEMTAGRVASFDAVVLAVPPRRLSALLGSPKHFGVFGLSQFREAPIVDVHLWYQRNPLGFAFAAVLDSPLQWIFEKSSPSGELYLCCSMSAANEEVEQPTQELVELCRSELQAVLPALDGVELLRSAVTRDREATFIPTIGLVRPAQRTSVPQVALAGAWTDTGWPATMESAVRSGRLAASALLETHAA